MLDGLISEGSRVLRNLNLNRCRALHGAHHQAAQFSPDQRLFPVPALIVEVLSPSTQANDRGVKFDDYARSGVREYWLVDPSAETVEIYAGANGAFEWLETGLGGRLRSRLLEGLEVDQ